MSKVELFEQMKAYFTNKQAVYMDHLQKMVQINSFTTNAAGVNGLGAFTAELFAPLGFAAERIPSVHEAYGDHWVLTRNGRSAHKIGLVSHLDTVFPPEEEITNDFVWRIAGERIYGPGTVDIKGGTIIVYMMMDALNQFAPELFADITWVILLDASEETDGTDFGDLCINRLEEDALACLVFEGGYYDDHEFNVVVARKGMAVYDVEVEGKASHAGSAHENGANAIVQMADVVQRIAGFTNYDDQITFNVGTIGGGTVTNRVPHAASAKVEMRAFDDAVYNQGISNMLALNELSTVQSAADSYPCRVSVAVTRKTQPWPRNAGTDRLLAVWQAAGAELGYRVHPEERGGLSDGNYFWHRVPSIDGMGAAGGNAHCSERSA
ncbi:MAG: M20/M25/M40 family metallo-hydrolase, partial [Anaerolineales bacterium]|nr:M20/M25/M40 family metallo-hydrolase [Anaerolineales bacterium]